MEPIKPMSVVDVFNCRTEGNEFSDALNLIRDNIIFLDRWENLCSQEVLRKAFTALLAVARGEYVRKDDMKERLNQCNYAMEYGAYNYDGSMLKDLKPGIIESTGVSDSLLIEVRNNKMFIDRIDALGGENKIG